MLYKSEVVLRLYRHSVDEIVALIGDFPMFILALVVLTLVSFLHLLLHFVVRKDNMLVVLGSVVFAAISMAAVYFFAMSQWDIEGYGRITVPLITYIVAEVFYLRFMFQVKEIDIVKSVEAKLEKIKGQHKGNIRYAFWYALSGDNALPSALGFTGSTKLGECFAVPFWCFINVEGKAEVYWGDKLRVSLIQYDSATFTGLRWTPISGKHAIYIDGKVATFG